MNKSLQQHLILSYHCLVSLDNIDVYVFPWEIRTSRYDLSPDLACMQFQMAPSPQAKIENMRLLYILFYLSVVILNGRCTCSKIWSLNHINGQNVSGVAIIQVKSYATSSFRVRAHFHLSNTMSAPYPHNQRSQFRIFVILICVYTNYWCVTAWRGGTKI